MPERKINLEEIIQKETDFVSKNNGQVYNIQDIKLCMKEFGKQLLELAVKNAEEYYSVSEEKLDESLKQSILYTINQVK